jgi:hypothetical protein
MGLVRSNLQDSITCLSLQLRTMMPRIVLWCTCRTEGSTILVCLLPAMNLYLSPQRYTEKMVNLYKWCSMRIHHPMPNLLSKVATTPRLIWLNSLMRKASRSINYSLVQCSGPSLLVALTPVAMCGWSLLSTWWIPNPPQCAMWSGVHVYAPIHWWGLWSTPSCSTYAQDTMGSMGPWSWAVWWPWLAGSNVPMTPFAQSRL